MRKLTIKAMTGLAQKRGGRCISPLYANSHSALMWECVAGHRWSATPGSIKKGRWCPACAHNQKLSLQEMQEIARERGGRCLSTSYENGRTPLTWECKVGHRWKAVPSRVKN